VVFAHRGALHLVLEVLAYAADEAQHTGSGKAVITAHADGSVPIADDGRGTDTRMDDAGRMVSATNTVSLSRASRVSAGDATIGATAHFLPDAALVSPALVPVPELRQIVKAFGPPLQFEIIDGTG
jgi:hypothetical protein